MAIDWGTAPDWLSGIGTVGTLGVAMVVLWHETGDRRRRDEQDRRRDEWERSAQARMVRLGPVRQAGGGNGIRHQQFEQEWAVDVSNDSDDVVHNVEVTLRLPSFVKLLDDEQPRESVVRRGVLTPGETLTARLKAVLVWPPESDDPPKAFPQPGLTFLDMFEQRWERDFRYVLWSDDDEVLD